MDTINGFIDNFFQVIQRVIENILNIIKLIKFGGNVDTEPSDEAVTD